MFLEQLFMYAICIKFHAPRRRYTLIKHCIDNTVLKRARSSFTREYFYLLQRSAFNNATHRNIIKNNTHKLFLTKRF